MQRKLFAILIAAVVAASSLVVISQNHSWSTATPTPSEMQVTSIPKTSKITLQLNRIPENFTAPALNSTIWIPTRSLDAQFQSEMVDVSQYRMLSVMTSVSPARQVNSSDTAVIFAGQIEKSLVGLETFVTFVDPDTGASTTIQINKDTYSIPIAGPFAFVSLGSSDNPLMSKVDPNLLTVVMYLSS